MRKRCDVDVRLRKSPVKWKKFPSSLKERLHQGTLRVERLREDIAAQAGTPSMPPVEIFPEVWITDEGHILGRAAPIEIGGTTQFGAALPAPTVVQPDDQILRAVLVHEFNHCFYAMVRAAEHLLLGRAPSPIELFGPHSAEAEEAALLDPREWFGPGDAESFIRWHDSRFDAVEPFAVRLAQILPVVTPAPTFAINRLDVSDWVMRRVEAQFRTGTRQEEA